VKHPVASIWLIGLWLAWCAAGPAVADDRGAGLTLADEIAHLADRFGSGSPGRERGLHDLAAAVYRDNGFQPFWSDPERIRQLLNLIEHATRHGLIPEDYNASAIRRLLEAAEQDQDPGQWAARDWLLTESLFQYWLHRRLGKTREPTPGSSGHLSGTVWLGRTPADLVRELLTGASLESSFDERVPAGPVYLALQSWLARYREIAETGGWPLVNDGRALREGDSEARVQQLRERLRVTGELAAGDDAGAAEFDPVLGQAVRTFQARHGLATDGVVGARTLAALKVPVSRRIDQIRLSLERLRLADQEAVATQLVVNIAGFRAFFYRDGEQLWDTRVVVGRSYRQTPALRSHIETIEINPSWTIPPTILRHDVLPAIQSDPDYLASNDIRVIDPEGRFVDPATVDWGRYSDRLPYTLRQDPGPDNSLGMVKFLFPNDYLVYLHDTPQRDLFEQSERIFSSGCIRVENPMRLAELLLNDPVKYSRAALDAIVDGKKTQRINLPHPVPIIVAYLTASIDSDGSVLFYRDVYDRDGKTLAALDRPAAGTQRPAD